MSKLQMSTVTEDEAGIRLDRWFKRHFPSLTHGQLEKLLRTGQVRVNGKRAESSTRLESSQEIRLPPSLSLPLAGLDAEKEKRPGDVFPASRPKAGQGGGGSARKPLQNRSTHDANDLKKLTLLEDEDILVLNKPAGLAVQGGTGLKTSIDAMLASYTTQKHGKPKLVHRLDRDTSGVLLIAKTPYAASRLTEAFRRKETRKIYWAVTLGVPRPDKGEIDAALVKRGETMSVSSEDDEDSKSAVSLYETLDRVKSEAAFVALRPLTGRTHQLRVHMASIGTPLLGDRLYGKPMPPGFPEEELGKGLHLHARRLIIPHPRKGTIDVTAPLSPEMRKTWKWFGFDPNAEADL